MNPSTTSTAPEPAPTAASTPRFTQQDLTGLRTEMSMTLPRGRAIFVAFYILAMVLRHPLSKDVDLSVRSDS